MVPQLWDRGFLAFDVCFLVSEAGLEASAGFLEGMAVACPLTGESLGPLVDWTISRGMSWDDCGLKKSSGSLFIHGWGCVLTQYFVWPRHPSTGFWVGPGFGSSEPMVLPALASLNGLSSRLGERVVGVVPKVAWLKWRHQQIDRQARELTTKSAL